MWNTEMVEIFRNMIDDTDEPYKYSNDKLSKLILIAGTFVKGENLLNVDYSINVETMTMTPDPTVNRDDTFINLVMLKAGCLLAGSSLLKTSKQGSFSAKEGSYSYSQDGRGKFEAQKSTADTWCSAYADAKWEYVSNGGRTIPGKAIIGPYRCCDNSRGLRNKHKRDC